MQRVFITSPSTKSGTTLLCWLLSLHSYIEQESIEEEILLSGILNQDGAAEADQFRISKGLAPVYKTSKNKQLLDQLYNGMVNPNGHEISAVKLVEFTGYDFLRWIWPDDPIITILRDPIDWWASRSVWRTLIGRPRPPIRLFTHLRLKAAVQNMATISNMHVVYYEDLIQDTEYQMSKIFQYLKWPNETLDISQHSEIYQQVSSFKNANSIKNNQLVTASIGQGRYLVSADEQDLIYSTIYSDPLLTRYFERYLPA